MARWSRSRLRTLGAGVSVLLGSTLLTVPVAGHAASRPAAATATAADRDRITVIPRPGNRPGIRLDPTAGGSGAPVGFVSDGGTVRTRRLGSSARVAMTSVGVAPAAARATTAAVTHRTTITVTSTREAARHQLVNLWNRDTWAYVPVQGSAGSLSTVVDLPPGNYFVASMYGAYQADDFLLTRSFTVGSKAQTVVLAESSARQVAFQVDDATARTDSSAIWLSLPGAQMVGFAGGPRTRTYVTPASIAGSTLRAHAIMTKAGSTALRPTPYRYDLTKSWPHPLPASLVTEVSTASLARTTTTVRAQGVTAAGSYGSAPSFDDEDAVLLPTPMRFPAVFEEYVTPDVPVWRRVQYGEDQWMDLGDRTLPVGVSASTTAGAAPLSPAAATLPSTRDGDRLEIREHDLYSSGPGQPGGDLSATVSMRLSAGGRLLQTSAAANMEVTVPAAEQTYRLEQTATRKVAWSQLSTKTVSEWTFASGNAGRGALPLMDLHVSASGLDGHNRAGTEPVGLTVVPSTRRIPAVSSVESVEFSTDDGATWTALPLTGAGSGVTAALPVPATAAFVALRVTAANDKGGMLRRTVLRAIAGPAAAGDETARGVVISNLEINDGRTLSVGTSGTVQLYASFTASAPIGIEGGGIYLWRGSYGSPVGVETGRTVCDPVNATTSTCRAELTIWDVRYSLAGNNLAGVWNAAVWATGKNGAGTTDRHRAGTLLIKRATRLTADAGPEPVRTGATVTVTGALTRADWDTGTYRPYLNGAVTLQRVKPGGRWWTNLQTVRTDAKGAVRTTVKAGADGSYRLLYRPDATSAQAISAPDAVDVR